MWLRLGFFIGVSCAITTSQAAVFTVDTTSDNVALSACSVAAADCSLRGAIVAAGDAAGSDAIEFAIPISDPGCDGASGICRIEVASDFPAINDRLSINGYSQPGAQPNQIPAPGANDAQLKIEIVAQAGFASNRLFQINGPEFELSGVAIALPSSGYISGGLRHRIVGNWFGVTASGAVPTYTLPGSVFDLGTFLRTIVIGGPDPADRNVIAGSGRDLSSPALPGGGSNRIRVNSIVSERGRILLQGNLVGLAPDGVTALPFRDPFIVLTGDDAFQTPDIQVRDNRFVRPVRNFSGFFGGALQFSVSRTMNEVALIQGNVFGLGVDGSVIGVQKDHIEVFLGNGSRVPRVRIGGYGAGEGNVFAGATRLAANAVSEGSAVILPNGSVSTFVEFIGNTMLGNSGIGLDYPHPTAGGGVAVGRTQNDVGDTDTGANGLQNHPDITTFNVRPFEFDLIYRVDSDPANSAYPLRVDFYRALGDEGEILLGSDLYELVDAQQPKMATVPLLLPPGETLSPEDVVVAIATDAEGRSSEFSFDTVELAIFDAPDPQPAGLPFEVTVVATATSGPFHPNGVVRVSMNSSPPISCEIALAPTSTPQVSDGSCELTAIQAGNRTLTATYLTLRGAFGSETGGDVAVTEPHEVTQAGPEQIGFPSCRRTALEGRDLVLLIARPSGGVAPVQVDLVHESGTATAGVDYIAPPTQTLSWAPGDVAAKQIAIPIAADAISESTESFRLRLQDAQGAAILPHALLEVSILDGATQGFRDGFEGVCPE